jgi:NodT family efflux transporter outer membrane factor (OMF) lipoprotein
MISDRSHVFLLALCLSIGSLAGCKVGPKYTIPPAPVPANFKEQPPANWKEAQPQDTLLKGNWWEIFGDAQLNALEEQVNVSNQNIAVAEAQFRAARAAVGIANADLFPTVTVSPTANNSRFASTRTLNLPGFNVGTGTFYQLPINVSYEADLWGRIRSNIAANIATAQATAADLENVRLSMQADLAQDYFQLRGLDEEARLYESTIAAFQRALELTNNRYEEGVASRADVVQAETQLETARAQAIDIAVARAQFEHAIAVLTGKPPAEFTISREEYRLEPPIVPVALPSELLERRPDVAGAERRIAAENAQIGVAKAAFFPRLTFSLTAGLESAALGSLLSWPSRFWSLGPTLSQIVFDAKRRRFMTRQAEANYDQAAAAYRQSVLTAFQEVEDNLAAVRILGEEVTQQDIAIKASQRFVDISLNRYRGGISTYLDVIVAQNVLLTNQRTAVGIRTRRMQASVLLIKALGGGWTATQLPSAKQF